MKKRKITWGTQVISKLHSFPELHHQMATRTMRDYINCHCNQKQTKETEHAVFNLNNSMNYDLWRKISLQHKDLSKRQHANWNFLKTETNFYTHTSTCWEINNCSPLTWFTGSLKLAISPARNVVFSSSERALSGYIY